MSGMSNVGGRGVYEAGDQRTAKNAEEQDGDRYHQGKENSHKADDSSRSCPCPIRWMHRPDSTLCLHPIASEDERTISNKLAREEKREHEEEEKSREQKQVEIDPTLPVRFLSYTKSRHM